METLRSVHIVLAACVAGSAWLGRRLERRFLSVVESTGATAATATQESYANLLVAIEGTSATVRSRWEDLQATIEALRADVCAKALADRAPNSPAVLIPEEHCLDIELKAALASHKINSVDDLRKVVADCQVLYDVLSGRESAGKLIKLCRS